MKVTKDKNTQLLLGKLLRAGVFTALTCSLLGGILYVVASGGTIIHYGVFEYTKGQKVSFFYSGETWGMYIIKLGIIVLILTPIARVVFSIIAFFVEKDYLYTLISFLVLFIMLCSMIYGFAG